MNIQQFFQTDLNSGKFDVTNKFPICMTKSVCTFHWFWNIAPNTYRYQINNRIYSNNFGIYNIFVFRKILIKYS